MYTLATGDGISTAAQTILYNSDTGLIQLMIPAEDTSGFPSGVYQYDLFITYMDNMETNATRLHRLVRATSTSTSGSRGVSDEQFPGDAPRKRRDAQHPHRHPAGHRAPGSHWFDRTQGREG